MGCKDGGRIQGYIAHFEHFLNLSCWTLTPINPSQCCQSSGMMGFQKYLEGQRFPSRAVDFSKMEPWGCDFLSQAESLQESFSREMRPSWQRWGGEGVENLPWISPTHIVIQGTHSASGHSYRISPSAALMPMFFISILQTCYWQKQKWSIL